MTQPLPTHRQAILLRCIAGERNYGRALREQYAEKMGATISIGALYETLADMEELHWVRSEIGEDTHERGGNRRKYFTITKKGGGALQRFIDTVY